MKSVCTVGNVSIAREIYIAVRKCVKSAVTSAHRGERGARAPQRTVWAGAERVERVRSDGRTSVRREKKN